LFVPTAVATSTDYDIRVAEDQLTATVRIEPGGTINPVQLIAQLKRTGIQFIDEAAITTAAAQLKKKPEPGAEPDKQGLTLVVARGQPKVEDVPERLVAIEPPARADTPENHYDRVQIDTVNPGDSIAQIIPPVIGRDGIDVFARPIKRRKPAQPVQPDEGALREGDLMKAARPGRARIEGNRIRVEPRLDIPTDVNFGTGNIRFDGDINIRGSVLDLFLVGSTADIHVGGAIEAAHVHAGANITVGGGIAGKDKGMVTAGGAIKCRYISNGHVVAGDGVKIAGEIANSRVITGGRVYAENGTILGSNVTANGGVSVRTLGSPAFVKTTVEVGVDTSLRQLAHHLLPDLNRCLSEVQQVKNVVAPLLRDRKRLSVAEREKATELLFSVARTDQELAAKLAEFRAAYEKSTARCKAEVLVSDTLFAGVTIRLPGLSAVVSATFKGPLIIAAGGERKKQIVISNEATGSVITLVTTRVADEGADELDSILQLAA
jgi:uncharacterized protein (DUF342 family)